MNKESLTNSQLLHNQNSSELEDSNKSPRGLKKEDNFLES
jgi:hypothetical protein